MEQDTILNTLPPLPWGRETIQTIIPHRDPFLWIDEITQIEPGVSVTGTFYVDPTLPFFTGHFPEHPVMPGVLLMEALAQTGGVAILASSETQGRIGFLAALDTVRFRNQVLPGDTVTLHVEITQLSARMCKAHAVATVAGKVAAEADQTYVIAPGL